jgi:hypothetical protein
MSEKPQFLLRELHLGFTYVSKNSRIISDWKEFCFRTARRVVPGIENWNPHVAAS